MWLKLDPNIFEHPKFERTSEPARLCHIYGLLYASRWLTDGRIPASFSRTKVRRGQIEQLVAAGIWHRAEGLEATCGRCWTMIQGQPGDGWVIHDFLGYNPAKREVEERREWDRRKAAMHRDDELVATVRQRDGDRCRYCGVTVDWRDRRGPRGGTYDYVIPHGPQSRENIVVACRRCSTRKGPRTPEQAGMTLLSSPGRAEDLGPRTIPNPGSGTDPGPFQNGPGPYRSYVPYRSVGTDGPSPPAGDDDESHVTPEEVAAAKETIARTIRAVAEHKTMPSVTPGDLKVEEIRAYRRPLGRGERA